VTPTDRATRLSFIGASSRTSSHYSKQNVTRRTAGRKAPLLDRDDLRKIANKGSVAEGGKLPSPEEQRAEIRRILELWESQLTASTDTVWATVGTSYTLEFYLTRCETRADIDGDEFEAIPEFEAVRAIIDRIETAEDTDSKLAIVHKRHLPLEEPAEE